MNFTGGEPMLFPDFLGLLEFAKKLGYTIYVGTNGTRLVDEKFAESALSYIDELSLSVHWYDGKSCIEQTRDSDHFKNFPKIIENINRYKTSKNTFFTNIVINALNYRDTLLIIEFLIIIWYPMNQILISVVAPEWIADKNFWELVFDLLDFQNYIPDIVSLVISHGILLRFFWLPICILGENYYNYANDLHWEERHTIERFSDSDGKIKLIDIYSPDTSRKRTFIKKCEGCVWKMKPCTGVFTRYLDYYDYI